MITWPAIIHSAGEDDLIYISSKHEWDIDPDLHFHPYSDGDVLIDSLGELYSLPYNDSEKTVVITKTGESIKLNDFNLLVKKHLSCLGNCCVSKLPILSFAEGMHLVHKSDEQT